ncbi:GNAT family N-acetyltransferase [Microvirga yunnanensis]|uniref:GNAT family N-acetyltransferase n=1 Tax=Microvirga yunnanensis TaxID=2953740 RepID=UPI0021C70408|nr:GNAT family N-acetyltransferase [Microvirga sp. HBU67655]
MMGSATPVPLIEPAWGVTEDMIRRLVETFFGRARRIADSLQIGLVIGPKVLHLPGRAPAGSVAGWQPKGGRDDNPFDPSPHLQAMNNRMSVDLRAAQPDNYRFAFQLYATTIKPYASAWTTWDDEDQEAHFAMLWRADDTRIIVLDGRKDVGWLEARRTGSEVFLKQLYVAPPHQRQGIGSRGVRKLLDEWRGTATSMAVFVLRTTPPRACTSDLVLRPFRKPEPSS